MLRASEKDLPVTFSSWQRTLKLSSSFSGRLFYYGYVESTLLCDFFVGYHYGKGGES